MSGVYLSAYLERIGFQGKPEPTLSVLKELHERHPAAIGFENIASITGQRVHLDMVSVHQKLVVQHRGGFCFEHNLLFAHMLRETGFQVTQLAGRVLWQMDDPFTWPRTHMLLKVEAEGETYIADVGFGGQTLVAPIRFAPDEEHLTPAGRNRIHMAENGDYLLQAKVGEEWKNMYVFDMQEQYLVDYEAGNWFVCTHPSSSFRTDLLAARVKDGVRFALFNNRLTVYYPDKMERIWLHSAEEIHSVLTGKLNINAPVTPECMVVLERIAALPKT